MKGKKKVSKGAESIIKKSRKKVDIKIYQPFDFKIEKAGSVSTALVS